MNRVIYAFLSSLIAGLSTCLGMIFTFIKPRDIKKFITISLSLAMGVMTLISIKELIPGPLRSIFRLNNLFNSLLIMVICPLIAMMIINISKQNVKNSDNLYRVGLLNMITLLLHNVPEGIVTFMSSITNKHLGLK